MGSEGALSWKKRSVDPFNPKTKTECTIRCENSDKLSWRRKPSYETTSTSKRSWRRNDKPEKILNDRLGFCLENVEKERCNMVVLALDGESMNAYLTNTNFESAGYLSTNKMKVIQLLVDRSFLTVEDGFQIVSKKKPKRPTHPFCVYWKLKDMAITDNHQNVEYFKCAGSAVQSFNEIFRSHTGYNWMEKSKKSYKKINNRSNIYHHHFLNCVKRKTVEFNYDSLSNPIQELLRIVNGIPPLSYTTVPDIYKRVWANISEENIFEARCNLFNIASKLKKSRNRDLNINLSHNFYSLIPSGTLKSCSRAITNYITLSSEINRLNFIEGINNDFPTKLTLLENDSETFKTIETAFTTTHGSNHKFKIAPHKVYSFDDGKVLQSTKKCLLWHGTHSSYVPGILRRGFNLPTTKGQMFGQAVYFTPCVSKASKYCNVANSAIKMERKGVLLLCEVDMENIECKHSSGGNFRAAERTSSIRGVGRYQTSGKKMLEGSEIFVGPMKDENPTAWINYDEYAVYNLNKIKVKYIVVTKFSPEISKFRGT